MKPANARNALNFLLRGECEFRGDEFGALLEVVKDLQEDMKSGDATDDPKVRSDKAETGGSDTSETS